MHHLRQLPSFLNGLKLGGAAAVVGGGPVAAGVSAGLAERWKGRRPHTLGPSDVTSDFPAGSLDLVYLDPPDKRYEPVREALRLWWPKVRADGGVLAGYGYADGSYQGHPHGVRRAVQELAACPPDDGSGCEPVGRSLQVRVTFDMLPTWYVVKGRVTPRPGTRKIALLTAHDEAQREVAELSSPNKATYCRRHGYDFVQRTDGFDRSRPPAWSKIRFLLEALPYYDWVFWSDADSLVTDPACPLEWFLDEQGYHVILPHDDLGMGVNHVNTGNWFVRNSPWAQRFLEDAWAQTDFLHDRLWENRAVIHLVERQDLSRQVQIVTQRRFNSYPGNHPPGDFIIHFADMPNDRRVAMMRQAIGGAAPS